MRTLVISVLFASVVVLNSAAQPALPKITGTVRDTNGAPAVGVEVKLFPPWLSSQQPTPKTDSNGRFEIKASNGGFGQNGTPFLWVRDSIRNLAVARDIEEDTKTYDLQLAPGLTISGRLQDELGRPLTNGTVQLVIWSGNSGFGIQDDTAKFDAWGRFKLATLPVGRRYSISVSAKGYGSASSNPQELDSSHLELPPFVLRVADQKIAGVVVDPDNNPVNGAYVSVSGNGQPSRSTRTDDQGRFALSEICEGQVQLFASVSGSYGNARAEAGNTNIVVRLGQQGMNSQPTRLSLVGKPLPDLTAAGIPADALPAKKPLLICLFDPDQRPSRRVLRLLSEQHDPLKQKGLTVVGISAAVTTVDAFKEWKQSNPQPFPIGGVTEKTDKTRWILETASFPCLILTDAQGRVKAEGFNFDELDAKLTSK